MVSDRSYMPLWGLHQPMFWVAYLHVRQPYLERAEDLFERAGPPVEFGVPRSFSGLGDMMATASLQSSRRRRGLDGSR